MTVYEYKRIYYTSMKEGVQIKPKNQIYARFCLSTRRKQAVQTLDGYLRALKALSKKCDFKAGRMLRSMK